MYREGSDGIECSRECSYETGQSGVAGKALILM